MNNKVCLYKKDLVLDVRDLLVKLTHHTILISLFLDTYCVNNLIIVSYYNIKRIFFSLIKDVRGVFYYYYL